MSKKSAALRQAIKNAGKAEVLARALQISPQAISQWKIVPATRVLDVERATGVSRHELRPDLYPAEQVPA